jgi:SAM-dependent methyltransferase
VFLRESGFAKLIGFEPSAAAAAAAEEHIKQTIRVAPFDGNALEANSASFIGCFMTLEHVDRPKEIAEAAYAALAPGGVFAAVVHDRSAILNRFLGRRSPIIDIEHLQLFSPHDLRMLMALAGFEQTQISHFANTYLTRYWARLLPLPTTIKRPITWLLGVTGLGSLPLKLRVGNMLAVGIK